jgi:hypothetical protein
VNKRLLNKKIVAEQQILSSGFLGYHFLQKIGGAYPIWGSCRHGQGFMNVPLYAPDQNSRNETYIQTSITGRSLHRLTEFVIQ